jgi:hypothetical protein
LDRLCVELSHPNRFQIVRENPHLTHQQAQNIVANYKQERRQKQGKPPKEKQTAKTRAIRILSPKHLSSFKSSTACWLKAAIWKFS